jgi:hypothetical protein
VNTERMKSFVAHPVIALVALVVAPVGLYEWNSYVQQERTAALERSERPDAAASLDPNPHDRTPYRTKYVNAPAVRPQEFHTSKGRGFFAEDEVIGVVVNGRPRAYLTEATRTLNECVISDEVAGRPITIVNAFEAGVIRVLTTKPRGKGAGEETETSPLELTIVGSIEGQLYLSGFGREFFFDAENIPLVDYPFSRCTWKVWRRAYPDSDLYIGAAPVEAE